MRIKQKRRCEAPPQDPTTVEGHLKVKFPFWVEGGCATIRYIDSSGSERLTTLTPGQVIVEVPVRISP